MNSGGVSVILTAVYLTHGCFPDTREAGHHSAQPEAGPSQQPPRMRRGARGRNHHAGHWSHLLNSLNSDDPLLRPSRPLPSTGHMLYASQRVFPPRGQTNSVPLNNPQSDSEIEAGRDTWEQDHPGRRTRESKGSNGHVPDEEGNNDDADDEDEQGDARPSRTYTSYPRYQGESDEIPDFLDDDQDAEEKGKKRQYYRDYNNSDDDGGYVRRDEFESSNKKMRMDMNAGFEGVLAAVREVAGIIDRLAHTAPPPTRVSPTPPKRSAPTIKITKNPMRRSAVANTQARELREHLELLAGGKDVLLEPQVDIQEAEDYATLWDADDGATTRPCCTATTFRIDILATPRSPWNRSAARVFCDSFIAEEDRDVIMLREVETAFFTRIKSLRKDYQKVQLGSGARLINARIARRNARKYLLFQRRYNIAQLIPQFFGRHMDILERLGVDGMSSDESDSDDLPRTRRQRVRFRVLTPRWRNHDLSNWLHCFDSVYWVFRRDKGPTRGDHPRRRLYNEASPKFSAGKKFVSGLPINAYNAAWLEDRRDANFSVLPQDDTYDFTHGNDLARYLNGWP